MTKIQRRSYRVLIGETRTGISGQNVTLWKFLVGKNEVIFNPEYFLMRQGDEDARKDKMLNYELLTGEFEDELAENELLEIDRPMLDDDTMREGYFSSLDPGPTAIQSPLFQDAMLSLPEYFQDAIYLFHYCTQVVSSGISQDSILSLPPRPVQFMRIINNAVLSLPADAILSLPPECKYISQI